MALERQRGEELFRRRRLTGSTSSSSGLKQEDESQVWEANFKAAEAAEGREGPE